MPIASKPYSEEQKKFVNKFKTAISPDGDDGSEQRPPSISPEDASSMAKQATRAALLQHAGQAQAPNFGNSEPETDADKLARLKAAAEQSQITDPYAAQLKAKYEEDAKRSRGSALPSSFSQ